jgi:hypothetical protein
MVVCLSTFAAAAPAVGQPSMQSTAAWKALTSLQPTTGKGGVVQRRMHGSAPNLLLPLLLLLLLSDTLAEHRPHITPKQGCTWVLLCSTPVP